MESLIDSESGYSSIKFELFSSTHVVIIVLNFRGVLKILQGEFCYCCEILCSYGSVPSEKCEILLYNTFSLSIVVLVTFNLILSCKTGVIRPFLTELLK